MYRLLSLLLIVRILKENKFLILQFVSHVQLKIYYILDCLCAQNNFIIAIILWLVHLNSNIALINKDCYKYYCPQ